ncbi:MFS transporter [Gracilibacillus sp. S3-1-1]|uniref:MFS transporter n=1 Tax=Gracilibacillus pellucidus TaxID=3095368 RepID=A0ACC6M713_9BACI|nr:MFS transporter [Gracilibacillus sp. S3-1-1]MDX8046637.1 MFS transporter [Gracilibacillus sp. S3-1-1]
MSLAKNNHFKTILTIRLLTNIGDSVFFIVSMWYIANHADLAIYAGIAVFLFTLPETLLIFMGPLVDRINPRKLLMLSTGGQIIVHGLIVFLFLINAITIPFLLVLLMFSAFFSAITYPIEETMLPQIVQGHELVKANSIFTIAYKIVDSLFDGLSGILLVVGTASLLYEINLFIFVIPLIILKVIKFNIKSEEEEKFDFASYKSDLKEGLMFVLTSNIKLMLIPLVFVNFFTAINTVALLFFSNTLTETASTYGILLAVSGVGSMLGAILVNKLEQNILPGRILTFGLLLNGLMWLCMTFSSAEYLAYLFLFLASFCQGAYNIIFASLFQVMTPVNLLGRVNTCVESVISFAMPIGAIIGGILIDIIPLQLVMSFNTISLVITSIIFFLNKNIYDLDKIDRIHAESTATHP